ncbi:hypothetical protein XCCB100_2237 [Xanthomonas campestris pv. campestris]|uniref:Uncharacterized protein n=1 Tax=Xanthomonas campestris pv. campestris (strain B100) TaxID=509169 RepID=B0RT06_XANCB|nr:hypothetical protein XCCB100_2237 [Xanthomonas campestris pv. campestris]
MEPYMDDSLNWLAFAGPGAGSSCDNAPARRQGRYHDRYFFYRQDQGVT